MTTTFPVDSSRIEGEQDLINATAVETIRGHGEVYVLDPGQLGSCPWQLSYAIPRHRVREIAAMALGLCHLAQAMKVTRLSFRVASP